MSALVDWLKARIREEPEARVREVLWVRVLREEQFADMTIAERLERVWYPEVIDEPCTETWDEWLAQATRQIETRRGRHE